MTEDLKRDLAELADRVRPVDVTQQAHRTARRLRIGRTAVAGMTALAVTVGGVAAAGAMADGQDGTPAAVGPASGPGADSIDGTFYDLVSAAPTHALLSWHADDAEAELLVPSDESWFGSIAALSPDGVYVADVFDAESGEIRSPSGAASAGDNAETSLVVRAVDGADETVLSMPGIDFWDMCSVPTWSPDGSRLYVDRGDEGFGFISAADIGDDDPEFNPVDRPTGCQIQVATNELGQDVYYSIDRVDGSVELVRTERNGESIVMPVGDAVAEAGLTLRGLTAVSTDGRMACLNTNFVAQNVDIAQHWAACDTIVDTESGQIVELPVEQNWETSFWVGGPGTFAEPNRLLVHTEIGVSPVDDDYVNVWQMYDYRGNLIDEVDRQCVGGQLGEVANDAEVNEGAHECTGHEHVGYLPPSR